MDKMKRAKLIFDILSESIELEKLPNVPVKEVVEFRCSLSQETDRGCALMAAAYLEYELEKLIKSNLVNDKKVLKVLFSSNGYLATFSSKIDLAYMLGLISPDVRSDLHILRKIRNEFAHNPESFGFEKEEISHRCNELKLTGIPNGAEARLKFTNAMMGVVATIHVTVVESKNVEPKHNIDLEEHKKFVSEFITKMLVKLENLIKAQEG